MEPHSLLLKCLRIGLIPGLAAGWCHAAEPVVKLDLGGCAGMELVLIRSGEFIQGSPPEEPGRGTDETSRTVRLTSDYYISRTSVTRGQWECFVRETGYRTEAETGTSGGFGWNGSALVQDRRFTWRDPGFPQTPEHPVCLVTFPDAQAFCAWLTRKTRRAATLPTEAQWEYACRAGTTTPWHSGSTPADCDRIIRHKGNSGNRTHPVDTLPQNPWGLAIGGNVSEWCLDWYAPYPPGAATDPRQDNPNLSDKPRRVLRGGSWLREAKNSRSASRYRADPRSRNADIGFRVVCTTEVAPPPPSPPVRNEPPTAPPKVEAEPGDPPRPVAPPPIRNSAPTSSRVVVNSGFRIGNFFGGLLCLLIPLGIGILLIRLIAKHGEQPAGNAPAPPPQSRARRPLIRKGEDGFWIDGEWPLGTALRLHYLVNGVATDTELTYRPGPNGQFVYTGSPPESVSVVPDSADPMPAPLFADPPVAPSPREDRPPVGPRPPIFPTAY